MSYKPLKLWFDDDLARFLAHKLIAVYSEFNASSFIENISSKIDTLELKDRVEVFADALYVELSHDYSKGIEILLKILGPENEHETGMFKEFYWIMPIAKYVEKYGLEDLECSIYAMEEITKRNTSEYTIRPFLVRYPEKMINQMKEWSTSENKHIRRLASEGGRPRLPWAQKLDQFIDDPTPLLPILRNLKNDPSKYVQKSVANCLNDILKDNPDIAKDEIESWLPSTNKNCRWIIQHAIRSLRKNEDPWALNIVANL